MSRSSLIEILELIFEDKSLSDEDKREKTNNLLQDYEDNLIDRAIKKLINN